MSRIAFVRSIEIQKTEPYLKDVDNLLDATGARAKLFYTDGECMPAEFPGEVEKMPPAATALEMANRIRDWQATGAISLSMPDENSLRDALTREYLKECNIPMVAHSVDVTLAFANKWQTKLLLEQSGLAIPPSFLVDGDLLNHRVLAVPAYAELLIRRAEMLGYPILLKPLWDSLGNGIRLLRDESDLRELLVSPFDGNFLLEKFVSGELCSVEILGTDNVYVSQPIVWKGKTSPDQYFPFDNVRYVGPRPTADAHFFPVADKLRHLVAKLQLSGAIEVEMIYADGVYRVIEVNPRVSGTTTISIAASGINTYVELTRMLLGLWQGATKFLSPARQWVFEFPTRELDANELKLLRHGVSVVRANTYRYQGNPHSSLVLGCPYGREQQFLDQLSEHLDKPRMVSPSIVRTIQTILE